MLSLQQSNLTRARTFSAAIDPAAGRARRSRNCHGIHRPGHPLDTAAARHQPAGHDLRRHHLKLHRHRGRGRSAPAHADRAVRHGGMREFIFINPFGGDSSLLRLDRPRRTTSSHPRRREAERYAAVRAHQGDGGEVVSAVDANRRKIRSTATSITATRPARRARDF